MTRSTNGDETRVTQHPALKLLSPNAMRTLFLLTCMGIAATCLAAGAGDVDRIQGVITELHPQGFILATDGRTVVVDMSALGGITMALAKGQAIAAIGTLAPDGKTFHAVRLETPARPEPAAQR